MTAFWESGDAPVIDPQGNIIMATGNGAFDAYPAGQGAPAGNTAVGWPGYGLGFAGIPNSVAVPLGVNVPSDSHNYTGLFYNGDFVTDKPVAPNVFRSLDGSPVDFHQAAKDQAGEHTMKVNLSYDGSTLTETITDETTGGVAKEVYTASTSPPPSAAAPPGSASAPRPTASRRPTTCRAGPTAPTAAPSSTTPTGSPATPTSRSTATPSTTSRRTPSG